jgi:WD40 repeat protein
MKTGWLLSIVVSLCFWATSQAQEPARVDSHGDSLPKGALVRLGTDRFRHTGTITAVMAFPGEDRITAVDSAGAVLVWDAQTGKKVFASKERGNTISLNWTVLSPDRQYLAIAEERSGEQEGLEDELSLVKVADGTTVHRFRSDDKKKSFFNSYVILVFNRSGSLLASGHSQGAVRLWDVQTGKLVRKLDGGQRQVTALCFAPDDKTLASCYEDKGIRLWQVADGKELYKLEHGNRGCAAGIAFTADGKQLISAGAGSLVPRFRKGGSNGSGDRTIRIWDAVTGKEIRSLPIPPRDFRPLPEIAVSPQSSLLACLVGNLVVLWNLNTG